jgi:hypothetical protein
MRVLCRSLRRFRFFLTELQVTFLEIGNTLDTVPPVLSRLEQLLVRLALLVLAAVALWQLLHH